MTPGRNIFASRRILMASTMVLCLACLLVVLAQQPQEQETTRHLWDTAFINQGNKAAANRRPARRSYRVVTPHVPVVGVSPDSVFAFTLWRLRPSGKAATGERFISPDGPESVTWLPERSASSGRLAEGVRSR